MQGRRVYPDESGELPLLQPGDYGRDGDGLWQCCAPRDRGQGWAAQFHGCLGNGESHHKVIEHGDGTITVSPSILITAHDEPHSWHGYLERGIWREC